MLSKEERNCTRKGMGLPILKLVASNTVPGAEPAYSTYFIECFGQSFSVFK